jgi:hypothetical protein
MGRSKYHIDGSPTRTSTLNIDLGDVDDDAARWWAAVFALEGGWNATIINTRGHTLHSPWYTKLVSEQRFTLSRSKKYQPHQVQSATPSFITALRYLSAYCEFHGVAEQSQAALAATLMLPTINHDSKFARLPTPRFCRKSKPLKMTTYDFPWNQQIKQLDRLITLSCNTRGITAMLSSVFYESGVVCNTCGVWLRATFAFLDSNYVRDSNVLLRRLTNRDPNLGFLWLGTFILGVQTKLLRRARWGSWYIQLNAAAWTGTFMSFIQEPIPPLSIGAQHFSRAEECGLLYLAHSQPYTVPPLFAFAPFGSTRIPDTNIEVRQHVGCKESHRLGYKALTWHCYGGQQSVAALPKVPLRAKYGQPTDTSVCVTFEELDSEDEDDEASEVVTRNVFTWLREQDGFPVAEKAIREHEWINNLDDSDDHEPVTGETRSTAGGNLHG